MEERRPKKLEEGRLKKARKTWPVEKPFVIGKYKISIKRAIFSAIVALLVASLFNLETVATFIPKRPLFYLPLMEYPVPTITQSQIENFVEQWQYVPNYDASIYLLTSERAEIGDYIQFQIIVIDNGILKLQKPYYFIFLVNPSDLVVSSFPGWGSSLPSYPSHKFSPWNTGDHPKDFYKDCLHIEVDGSDYWVPRETLIDGHGKYVYVSGGSLLWSATSSDVLFRYKIKDDASSIGRWRIYVFVYDEKYFDRFGQVLKSDNFVNYMVGEFSVASKSPPAIDLFHNVYWRIITFIASVVSFIGSYRKINDLIAKLPKEKFKIVLEKMKKHSICIIIMIMLFVFIVLLYATYWLA